MTTGLQFTEEALEDINDAFRWYENKQPGLGSDFLVESEVIFWSNSNYSLSAFKTVRKDFPLCTRISADCYFVSSQPTESFMKYMMKPSL